MDFPAVVVVSLVTCTFLVLWWSDGLATREILPGEDFGLEGSMPSSKLGEYCYFVSIASAALSAIFGLVLLWSPTPTALFGKLLGSSLIVFIAALFILQVVRITSLSRKS